MKLDGVIIAAKPVADITATGIVIGTILTWLPAAAALITIVWYSFRIYECDTVQRWIGKNKT